MIHDNRQLQRESYRQDKEKDGFERKNKKPILTEHKNIKRMEFKKNDKKFEIRKENIRQQYDISDSVLIY